MLIEWVKTVNLGCRAFINLRASNKRNFKKSLNEYFEVGKGNKLRNSQTLDGFRHWCRLGDDYTLVLPIGNPCPEGSGYIRGGLISLWLYNENKRLRGWKNVFTLYIPPWASNTYDFVVPTSSTHPRKILLIMLQIGKSQKLLSITT
jgi:hypothetical protein